jgi:class 3 adenylate cyclase
MLFGNFIACVVGTSAILFAVELYALREVARAEGAADREYARSESLLANVLPASIAAPLKKATTSLIADKYDAASVLFADMSAFTARLSDPPPEELVRILNRVFTDFDQLVESYGLEKIKTTGNAYMVVSGVPVARPARIDAERGTRVRHRAKARSPKHGARTMSVRMGGAAGVPAAMASAGCACATNDVRSAGVGTARLVYSELRSTVSLSRIVQSLPCSLLRGLSQMIQEAATTNSRAMHDALTRLYGAVMAPAEWPAALENVTDLLHADHAIFLGARSDGGAAERAAVITEHIPSG